MWQLQSGVYRPSGAFDPQPSGGGAAFAPTDLGAALKGWYDFNDVAAITKDGSNNVTAVADKSTSAMSLTNSTGSPVYSATALQGAKPGLTFSGAPYLTGPWAAGGSTAWNAFCVYQATANTNFARIIAFNDASHNDYQGNSTSYAIMLRDNSSGEAVASYWGSEKGISPAQTFNSASAVFTSVNNDGTTNTAYLNGVAGSGVAFAPGTITPVELGIGYAAGTGFTGVISEILLVSGGMTTLNRQKVEGYLAWKWGLQAQLPAGHPYLSAAP